MKIHHYEVNDKDDSLRWKIFTDDYKEWFLSEGFFFIILMNLQSILSCINQHYIVMEIHHFIKIDHLQENISQKVSCSHIVSISVVSSHGHLCCGLMKIFNFIGIYSLMKVHQFDDNLEDNHCVDIRSTYQRD